MGGGNLGLSYWDYNKYRDDVFDDTLIKEALELLQKRHQDMENWIRKNIEIKKCPECGYNNLEYRFNGIKCKRPKCEFFKEVKVPSQVKSGVAANRTFEGIIKEIFGRRMGAQKQREKPSADKLNELPFDIDSFDSGEYNPEQIKFLKNRYQSLLEENNISNEVDKFYIRSLCMRELEIMKLERLRAVDPDEVKTTDLKRQYEIYNKLTNKVKASKDARDDDDEQRFYKDMEDVLEDSGIEDLLKKYDKADESLEEYKEKSKQRREKVGNPY